MRKTRFMSMLFLVWSIAFFFVPDFRQGLQVPFFALSFRGGTDWLVRAGIIPAERLAEAARRGEQQRDAHTLAFVALHAPTLEERLRCADEAVAIDPSFTWIYIALINRALDVKQNPPDVPAMIARLEKWDPDNALPYFLEAGMIFRRKNIISSPTWSVPENLAKETEWCQAMQKAFSAPHFDTYFARRFELERTWLRQNHLDKPAIVLLSMWAYSTAVPNPLQTVAYAHLVVDKYGKEAEDAKHLPEALGYYWTAEHFSERMRMNSFGLLDKLVAVNLYTIANKRLIPALRNAGQADAAKALEMGEEQLAQQLRGRDLLAQSANYGWAALIVEMFGGLVAIFSTLTVVCLLYVNAKRWVRPESKGRLYHFLTVAENYMPVLLFLACVGLYLSYYPYAQNFHHYMTAAGEIHDLWALIINVFPLYDLMPYPYTLPVGDPFLPYAWYALVGLILAVLAAIPYHHRTN